VGGEMSRKNSLFDRKVASLTDDFSKDLAALVLCRPEIDRFGKFCEEHSLLPVVTVHGTTDGSVSFLVLYMKVDEHVPLLDLLHQAEYSISDAKKIPHGLVTEIKEVMYDVEKGDFKFTIRGYEEEVIA
jgi:hypothetical protein